MKSKGKAAILMARSVVEREEPMRAVKCIAATMIALLIAAAGAEAAVSVTFVYPERYRDRDFRDAAKRASLTADLTRQFEKLDKRYLRSGQRLSIEVLDVRLAGQYEPWRTGFDEVRILRDVTPPRFKLRYTLRDGKRILARGEETLTDPNYLWSPAARRSGERLVYEKTLLRDWFRKRFGKLSPSGT